MKEREGIFGNPFQPETLERGITEPLKTSVKFWSVVVGEIYKKFEKSEIKDVLMARATRFL